MAIMPLSSLLVDKYLNSEEFKVFSREAAKSLNVDDLFSSVEYKGVCEKYPQKQKSLAFTDFSKNYKSFRGIYFNTEKIAGEADELYRKYIDLDVRKYALKVFVNFLLIHELTHVSQFKMGDFERYAYNPSSSIKGYKNDKFEIEANTRAYNYLKDRNSCTKKILDDILRAFNE